MKTGDSKETVRAFSNTITKKNRSLNFCVDKCTEYARDFENFFIAEGIQTFLYYETKHASDEGTIRSLVKILHR